MTTAAIDTHRESGGSTLIGAVALGVALGALLTAFGVFGWVNGDDGSSSHTWLDWAIDLSAIVVIALVVYRIGRGGMRPGNATGAARRSLAFGALALLMLPFFWLGVYAVFAAAALALGVRAVGTASSRRNTAMAIIGMILAGLGLVASGSANLFG